MLEKLDETRRRALQNYENLQRRRKASHDAARKLIKFHYGDLLMLVDQCLVKQHGQKFRPKWQGLFAIYKSCDNETYKLSTPDGVILRKWYNGSKLKLYRCRQEQAQLADSVPESGEEMIRLILAEPDTFPSSELDGDRSLQGAVQHSSSSS